MCQHRSKLVSPCGNILRKVGDLMNKTATLALLAALPIMVLITLAPISTQAGPGPGPRWGRGDIRTFPRYDARIWRGGRWYHGGYGGRLGWWWIVAGTWYFYPGPVYPYPDPYVPPVVVTQTYPTSPAAPVGPAPTQYWYYCAPAKGYYPYVPSCAGGWEKVPSTPPPGTPPG